MKLKSPILSIIVAIALCLICQSLALSITGGDVINSAGNLITGIGAQLVKSIPTIDELFYTSVQVLFGLPELAVAKILNEACSIYVSSGNILPRITPKAEEMYLQLRTPYFDIQKKVVIFVSGWTTDINETDNIEAMAKAYNCQGDYNFVYVNTSNFVQTLYSWSAFNTDAVGTFIGDGLVKLAKRIPPGNIHLIGHSLGAQMAGKAGRHFISASGKAPIGRITGLDPANPCFNEGEKLSGIFRGDAAYVDIIHTNTGVLGIAESVGDADFYPAGLGPIKPGCIQFGCSHSRAVDYYIESIYPDSQFNFMATRCNSLTSLNRGRCEGPFNLMGFASSPYLKGNYFLNVNTKYPFGKNGVDEFDNEYRLTCGRCNN
ncbi:phospholipase A1-like isoform X2 [Haematobia irritans]|uniref:phospholipase A1-like isoform X2 n=1 Tax=Haematobia irritans TaxID=7368 RepID=UPI003F4F5AFD